MRYSSELVKGSTKTLVMAAIGEGEMYGYQIIKAIKNLSDSALAFGEGSIYPALHSLERAKLVSSRWASQENLPDRKYYSLTAKGKSKLQEQIAEWQDFSKAVNKIYHKLQTNIL